MYRRGATAKPVVWVACDHANSRSGAKITLVYECWALAGSQNAAVQLHKNIRSLCIAFLCAIFVAEKQHYVANRLRAKLAPRTYGMRERLMHSSRRRRARHRRAHGAAKWGSEARHILEFVFVCRNSDTKVNSAQCAARSVDAYWGSSTAFRYKSYVQPSIKTRVPI